MALSVALDALRSILANNRWERHTDMHAHVVTDYINNTQGMPYQSTAFSRAIARDNLVEQ